MQLLFNHLLLFHLAEVQENSEMENNETRKIHNSTLKTHKLSLAVQICLRFLATAATLAATWIILTSNQTVAVFGIVVDARYSYSPAFK